MSFFKIIFIVIAFINKTNYAYDIDDSREIILKSIKEMINK